MKKNIIFLTDLYKKIITPVCELCTWKQFKPPFCSPFPNFCSICFYLTSCVDYMLMLCLKGKRRYRCNIKPKKLQHDVTNRFWTAIPSATDLHFTGTHGSASGFIVLMSMKNRFTGTCQSYRYHFLLQPSHKGYNLRVFYFTTILVVTSREGNPLVLYLCLKACLLVYLCSCGSTPTRSAEG